MSGVGIVIGAGIYVLIGEAARDAGAGLWIAFVLAAVLSALTGLSYAELAGMFPTAGAEFEFARQAFNDFVGFIVGWTMALANIIAAAAVSIGFAHYVRHFVDAPERPVALALLFALTLVVAAGVQRSIWFSVLLVTLQVGGLMMVVAAGAPHVGDRSLLEGSSVAGVLSGAALVFFAFIGFDEVVTLSEETRDAARVIPRALLVALGVSTALYVAVGIASVSVIEHSRLAESPTPLTLVIAHDWGTRASDLVAAVALASTTNTSLLVLIAASRLVFGMARRRTLPPLLATVSQRAHAPWVAAIACFAVAACFTLIGDIGLVASVTDFAVYAIFVAVNASLVILRRRRPDAPRTFVVPLAVRGVPVLPLLGTATVAVMLAYLEPAAWAIGAASVAAGVLAWFALASIRRTQLPATPRAGDVGDAGRPTL